MSDARRAAACSVILAWAVTAAPGLGVDLSVGEIEITQGILAPSGSVPLIANRSLAVRVTVNVSDSPGPVPDVTGTLTVLVDGVPVTPCPALNANCPPAGGLGPINAPFTATLAPDPADEDSTLNFEILAPTGIGPSNDVDFIVELDTPPGESNAGNNTGSVTDLTFVSVPSPTIYYVRVYYTPAGFTLFPHDLIAPGVGPDFIRAVYPIDDSAPALYQDAEVPTLNYSYSCNDDDQIDVDCSLGATVCALCEHDGLFQVLESCRQLIVNNGVGVSDNILLYGWVNGNPIAANGYASQGGGRVAFGNTAEPRFQKTFAHEIGHLLLGNSHSTASTEHLGWDVGSRIDVPDDPFPSSERLRPAGLAGLMGTQPTAQTWILESEYLDLLDAIEEEFEVGFVLGGLVLSGVFNPPGSDLALDPVFQYPWPSQPTPQRSDPASAPFVAIVTDANGQESRRYFDAPQSDESGRGSTASFGFFSLVLPPPQAPVASLRIMNREETVEYAGFTRSEPPTVEIIAPQPGVLASTVALEWRSRDPDTPAGDLMSHVVYSADNGLSFRPLGVRLRENRLTVNAEELSRAQGTGLIRVFVSDGLNTSYADLPGLSTPGCPTCEPRPGWWVGAFLAGLLAALLAALLLRSLRRRKRA